MSTAKKRVAQNRSSATKIASSSKTPPASRGGPKTRAGGGSRGTRRPVQLTGKKIEELDREEGGPLEWLLPKLESAYTGIVSREVAGQPADEAGRAAAATPAMTPLVTSDSTLQPSGKTVLALPGPAVWRDILIQYKRRKGAAAPTVAPGAPPAPFVPGARNWLPLGPSVVLQGQTVSEQPVAGRVSGLAVAPGGTVVYAASANGGVFRSDDGATTWRSLMDRFDLDPTNFASASLVCGAIAIDAADPRRVYVGTGEGDTLQLFRARIASALPAYRGVGPIRSDDGGKNWVAEPSTPDLAGEAFFALAVDPRDRERVLAATTQGLYRREPRPGGQFEWLRVRSDLEPGVYSSVVVASGGGTSRFFCAQWGQKAGNGNQATVSGVFHSDDGGSTWSQTGNGLPNGDTGRIALGVKSDEPDVVYAFIARRNGAAHSVCRLDGMNAQWKKVTNVPDVLLGSQGAYDLTIAVDPQDVDLIYLGGDRTQSPPYPGSVWRCAVQATGNGVKVKSSASIGTHAHADVHILVHTPGDPTELWCGCDGGVFLNRDPRGTGEFAGQNNGLACLCSNFIGQHPTDPNVLFSGLQDNGTARTAAGPIWSHVNFGDGGYCVVNWANPDLVLVFANGTVYRSSTGGTTHGSWQKVWDFRWATMTQPIVEAPFDPTNPADADIVALGAGGTVFVSEDFGATWPEQFDIPGGDAMGNVFALTFASPTRLYIGTTRGHVFRADRTGGTWSLVRLDDAPTGPLVLDGLVSDVAVDWADRTLSSVYVSFGGMGDYRRVWWYDGTRWEPRSGAAGGNGLLDVEHNALVVDRAAPNNVYVGADIGVWHSSDGGQNWNTLQNGLPDAPVFDLQIHLTQRLLRAATHGRGVFEIALN